MTVQSFTFGPFQTNTYVVSDLSRDRSDPEEPIVLLVDPACYTESERQTLADYIDSLTGQSVSPKDGLCSVSAAVCQPKAVSIIATHGHLDHLWGAKWATERWQTPVLMHEADIPMARAMQDQYTLFGIPGKPEPFPIEPLSSVSPKDGLCSVSAAVCQHSGLSVLPTPGHTPGSVCLYWPDEKVLLSGDTLFCMGYGRTDLPGGSYADLIESIRTLFDLPEDVIVYPGHGESTTIGAEKHRYW